MVGISVASLVGSLLMLCVGADKHPTARISVRNFPLLSGPSPELRARMQLERNLTNGDWFDAAFDADSHVLGARADDPAPSRYGPLFAVPGCVFCPDTGGADPKDGLALLRHLSRGVMKSYTRGVPSELKNKCVFYSAATLNTNGRKRLSGDASAWACARNKYSIWHLWPNAKMATPDGRIKDFYGIFEQGNWLQPIKDLPKQAGVPAAIVYFQRMSGAMAELCSGEVVIMTEEPDNMDKFSRPPLYPNIWETEEREALMRNSGVTNYVIVDINTNKMWEFDIEKRTKGSPVTSLKSRELDDLIKRDGSICSSSGVDSEPAGMDIFAGNWNDFPPIP